MLWRRSSDFLAATSLSVAWMTFDAIFDGFKAISGDFSDAERSAHFHDNAQRVYRIDAL
jgi:predicted TIM-barrel fold metal-dependent hydrolase